jgi:hypothetical protein
LSEYLSKYPDAQLVWIGYRIFKWLLLLVAVVMVSLGAYAYVTYPTIGDIQTLLPSGRSGTEIVTLTKEMREAWLSDVKDLAQNFLLTPIMPLLAAVVGYIFGRSHSVSAKSEDGSQQSVPETESGSTLTPPQ